MSMMAIGREFDRAVRSRLTIGLVAADPASPRSGR
jgi:hypothetical protein